MTRRNARLIRSETATSATKTSRIAATSAPANIFAALSSNWPRPPAPTSPSTTDERIAHSHRLEAVRAHLLERAGEPRAAREAFLRAARMTASVPEQRYLTLQAARLGAEL